MSRYGTSHLRPQFQLPIKKKKKKNMGSFIKFSQMWTVIIDITEACFHPNFENFQFMIMIVRSVVGLFFKNIFYLEIY